MISLLFMAAVTGWHLKDNRPSSMDETKHMQLAMDYRDWAIHHVPLQNPWVHVYPPFYHISIIPLMSMGIPTEAKAVLAHGLYVLIFVWGCLLLGRLLGRTDDESLAAALIVLGYAYVLWTGRRSLTDFPLLAWVTLSMALLARTQGFVSRRLSLWWGLSAGIGMLLKFTFTFFFILPVIWTAASDVGPWSPVPRAERVKNAILALGVALVLGGSWYFWNSAFFFDKAFGLVQEVTSSGTDPRTLAGWLYYVKLWPFQLGVPQTIFTATGIVLCLVSKVRSATLQAPASRVAGPKSDGLLWMWFLSGYLVLSLMMNKDPRHTLPILPAVAILAVGGWSSILPVSWRAPGLWMVAALLFGFTVLTYDRPAKEDRKMTEIYHLLADHHDAAQPLLIVSVLSHHPRLFARGLKWAMREKGLSVKTTGAGKPDASFAEFIFLRQGPEGTGLPEIDQEWQGVEPKTRAFQKVFFLKADYPLPDQSHVLIYQRSPHPHFELPGVTAESVARRLSRIFSRWVKGPLYVTVHAERREMREGRLEQILASCKGCQIQGVTVPEIDVLMESPWINLYRLWDENAIGLLAFDSIHARVRITEAELAAPLAKVRGFSDARVELMDGKIKVSGKFHGIPVAAVACPYIILTGHPRAEAILERIYIAGIPLPGWIIGKAYHQTLWFEPQPSFPGRVDVSKITVQEHQLILE